MYAIVEIAGQQYKVIENQKIFVNRLPEKEGETISLKKVLMINKNGKVKIGNPIITEDMVTAKVLSHLKGDKVLVFKKKRRKGYKKLRGHRQYLSQIQILSIGEKSIAPEIQEEEKIPKVEETKISEKDETIKTEKSFITKTKLKSKKTTKPETEEESPINIRTKKSAKTKEGELKIKSKEKKS